MKKISKHKILAIIPAKSQSRRLKNKNKKKINGLELFIHAIEIAKKSKLINKIYLSTDSEAFTNKAHSCGIDTPFMRPKKLSTNKSPIIETLIFTINQFEKKLSYRPDFIVVIQPTSPLLNPDLIDKALSKAIKKKADSVVGLLEVDTTSHPYNLRKVVKKGIINFVNEKQHYLNIEKNKEKYFKSGGIFVSSRDTIIKHKRIEGKRNFYISMDKISALDINDKEDFYIVSKLMEKK